MTKRVSKKNGAGKFVYLYTYVAKEQREAFVNLANKKRMSQSAYMRVVLDALFAAESKSTV